MSQRAPPRSAPPRLPLLQLRAQRVWFLLACFLLRLLHRSLARDMRPAGPRVPDALLLLLLLLLLGPLATRGEEILRVQGVRPGKGRRKSGPTSSAPAGTTQQDTGRQGGCPE